MESGEAWEIYRSSLEEGVQLSEAEQFIVDEALDFLLKNAQPGDKSIMAYNLATNYYGQGKKELALKYFEYGANYDGNSLCCSRAGAMYYYGCGVPVDYEKAFKYLNIAYEKRWYEKSFLLGEMYDKGLYVEKNHAKAVEIWEKCI